MIVSRPPSESPCGRGKAKLGTAATSRFCFLSTTGVLVVFSVARALELLGPPLVATGLLVLALLVVARATGMGLAQLGLSRAHLRDGLRYGVVAFAAVVLLVALAAALPVTSGLLHDSRAQIGLGRLLYELGIVVILITAVPEELAFRGLLLASGSRTWGPGRASLASSALFGLWHIAPSLSTLAGNQGLNNLSAGLGGQVTLVLGAVGVTFLAGLLFCWLRLRSGSLLAPLLAHVATNGASLTVAWVIAH